MIRRASIDVVASPLRRLTALLGALAVWALLGAGPAAASSPTWSLAAVAAPTNFTPGDSSGHAHYQLLARNQGSEPTDGSLVSITVDIPAGLNLDPAGASGRFATTNNPLACTAAGQTVTCSAAEVVAPGGPIVVRVPVDIEQTAASTATMRASISGGGGAPASAEVPTTISATPAPFGFHDADIGAVNADGSPDLQAGSHPFAFTTSFTLNTTTDVNGTLIPVEDPKDVRVDLPPGLVGAATSVPQCSQDLFNTPFPQHLFNSASCPSSTAVGFVGIEASGEEPQFSSVYNLTPPPGAPAEFGFNFSDVPVVVIPSVRTGGDYGLSAESRNTSQAIRALGVELTLWGVPADSRHNDQRGLECLNEFNGAPGGNCPAGVAPKPFLTLPTSCAGPLTTTISATSWQSPTAPPVTQSILSHDGEGNPAGLSGCNQLDFSPTISLTPDTSVADSPSGLHVDLHLPQNENPEGLAEADLRDAVVKLPPGLTVDPSSAQGLAACSEAQIELNEPNPASCPDASKIGSVEVDTPLLEKPIEGGIYLAKQGENKFGSLLAIYLAVDDPQTGIVVKLAGHVEADAQTGQLTTSFAENPQIPFEDLKLDFFSGPRAPLRTPSTCGTFTTTTDLTPWSSPQHPDATPSDSFQVSSAPGGGACAATPAQRPFSPSLLAQSQNPFAGAYSPFALQLSRADGSQEIDGLQTTLPKGLLAKLKGVPYCPDAQIAQAAGRDKPGQGALEQASPSCPAASQVGSVNVAAGAGPNPLSVPGKAYLAGPYKGAPLSLAIVTPAIAGPFDLGTVVVRAALQVNPESAQVKVVSDPIPTILQGIPLDIRRIYVNVDRQSFTRNPTNCKPMSVGATATSTDGAAAALSNPFQVGSCGGLGFAPKLALSLEGPTKRNSFPALKARLTYPKGNYANIAKAQVTLPHSEFLEQGHIGTVCTNPQFAAGACPKASIYGTAEAKSPLLEKPLKGPVYLRTPGHKLPDLVADLKGQIEVTLRGKIDTGTEDGLRTTFQAVPDAPVSEFRLNLYGGKKGLLVNSEDLCSPQAKTRAIADFTGQNGKAYDTTPMVGNGCRGKPKKGKAHGGRHR